MHELSIAVNIVEIAEQNAKDNNVTSFSEMELEIGSLSGVVIEALEFALDEAVKDSCLQNSKVIIHTIEAKLECQLCKHIFISKDYITPCPQCNGFDNEAIQGKELKIMSLTT